MGLSFREGSRNKISKLSENDSSDSKMILFAFIANPGRNPSLLSVKGKLFYCQKAIKKVLFCQKIVRFDAYFLTEKIPSKKGVQTCTNLTFADCTFADGHLLPRHSD